MKERIKCPLCGAKNELVDLCRICGTLLPGFEKRRREGIGGDAFHETVERERERWRDYSEGRMSSAARSRRPESLPEAPPGTWGVGQDLLEAPLPIPDAIAAAEQGPASELDDEPEPKRRFLRFGR